MVKTSRFNLAEDETSSAYDGESTALGKHTNRATLYDINGNFF